MKWNGQRSRNTNKLWQQCNTEQNYIKPLMLGQGANSRYQNNRDFSSYRYDNSEHQVSGIHEQSINCDIRRASIQNMANVPQYFNNNETRLWLDMKSNFQKYQDSVAKDEYWKLGQTKGSPNAIYDSMQFLSMKREKSMNIYNNHLKREKSNPLFNQGVNNGKCYTDSNDLEYEDSMRQKFGGTGDLNLSKPYAQNNIYGDSNKVMNYSNNRKQNFRINALGQDYSMNNILNESFEKQNKRDSPESANSMWNQRIRNFDNAFNRQKLCSSVRTHFDQSKHFKVKYNSSMYKQKPNTNASNGKLSYGMNSNQSPNSVNEADYKNKQSSPQDSKFSYHSHYLNHDGSPVSLSINNIKGRNSKGFEANTRNKDNSLCNVYSTNYIKDSSVAGTNQVNLEQQPTFSLNSNTQLFKQNWTFLSEHQKAQSSRLQNFGTSSFPKAASKNLKIDVDFNNCLNPDTSLSDSWKAIISMPAKSQLSNQHSSKQFGKLFKRNKEVETKYISLDPFADRKHSTRTDGDINTFHVSSNKEDMRTDAKQGLNESSSITPKTGFYSIEEVEIKKSKPRKVRIKASRSSNRLHDSETAAQERQSKIIITKDEENNVYHIASKESIPSNNIGSNSFFSVYDLTFNLESKRTQDNTKRNNSKSSSSGIKRKKKTKKNKINETHKVCSIINEDTTNFDSKPKHPQRVRKQK